MPTGWKSYKPRTYSNPLYKAAGGPAPSMPYAQPPKPPAGTQPQTPPPDPNLIAAQTSASRNVALGDAQSAYQGTQIRADYGLDPAFAGNAFSYAKLLEDTYRRGQRGTRNSAGNQLYSGAYQRAQADNKRTYDLGYYNLTRDYTRQLQGLDWSRLQNYATNSMGVDDATFASLLKRLGGN